MTLKELDVLEFEAELEKEIENLKIGGDDPGFVADAFNHGLSAMRFRVGSLLLQKYRKQFERRSA